MSTNTSVSSNCDPELKTRLATVFQRLAPDWELEEELKTIEDDTDRSFFRKQFRAGAGVDPPDDLDPPAARRVVITIFAENVSSPELYGGRFDVS